MWFSLIIGVLEKFFAEELIKYMERYHEEQKATNIANVPLSDKAERDYWANHP